MIRETLAVAIATVDAETLERCWVEARPVDAIIVGAVDLSHAVTPEQAPRGIRRVRVVGSLQVDRAVRPTLEGRMVVAATITGPS